MKSNPINSAGSTRKSGEPAADRQCNFQLSRSEVTKYFLAVNEASFGIFEKQVAYYLSGELLPNQLVMTPGLLCPERKCPRKVPRSRCFASCCTSATGLHRQRMERMFDTISNGLWDRQPVLGRFYSPPLGAIPLLRSWYRSIAPANSGNGIFHPLGLGFPNYTGRS